MAYCQEPALQKIFLEGRDIFTEMAAELGWDRKKTKGFVYATQYGGGPARIAYIFGVSIDEAKVLIEKFYRRYPRFRAEDKRRREYVAEHKKMRLWSRRVRHFARKEDSYKAFNALLQGGAADVVERVWVHVMENLDNHPVLTSAAYNAGPSRAKRWRADRPLEGAIYAETIPFSETRDYVKKVMSNAVFYQTLMTGSSPSLKVMLGTIGRKSAPSDGVPDLP